MGLSVGLSEGLSEGLSVGLSVGDAVGLAVVGGGVVGHPPTLPHLGAGLGA